MKRITLLMLSVLIILFSVLPVNAAETVSFTVSDVECNVNRLFTVDVKAQSSDMLSVATFEFTYDRNVMEFRDASCDDNSYIRAYDNGESVKVSYLCSDGIQIDSYTTIFTLKFKSLSDGKASLDYSVSDCVNSSVEYMPIGDCTSGIITVSEKSLSEDNISSKSESKTDNSYSKASSEKDRSETSQNEASTLDQLGFLNNSFSDNTKLMFIVGILCGSAFVVVIVSAFFIGRSFAKSDKNDKKS